LEFAVIKDALRASVIEGNNKLAVDVEHFYASDLMSDVLAFGLPNSVLLTGLATRQAVVSAHMAEFKGVVFIRGKKPKDGSKDFARENNLVLLSTDLDMYEACVKLDSLRSGKNPKNLSDRIGDRTGSIVLQRQFQIRGNDFANAGTVSTEVKSILKKIGFDNQLVRRVAISTFEGELNVIMHAEKATANLSVTSELIEVTIDDCGQGIPDIDLAMQEGYSTATEEERAMGFGSGMGLPNIKKNADQMNLESRTGRGTKLNMKFYI
jgi:anti-sigma regulatory factor (Ser/Thr protein kinase)